jgi:hypothetical protein
MPVVADSAVKSRRSIYSLSKKSPISDPRIEDVLKDALKHSPSAFNSQSGRLVLLLGKALDELLDTVKEIRPLTPPEAFLLWSGNSTGILQYVVWTSLELEGLGARESQGILAGGEPV